MATTTLSVNPQKITVSGTTEHQINCDAFILDENEVYRDSQGQLKKYVGGYALIKLISGTSVQFSCGGQEITADSAALQSSDDRFVLPVRRYTNIRYKGGAGGEVFSITIHP